MRNTRRIKRMSRNRVKITKMNLTSLMDVFTILVFFLLVNSGSVEIMEAPKNVTLPESMIEELKLLANKRDVPYQSLLEMFLAERLDKELKAIKV